jgi:hypothetical protein
VDDIEGIPVVMGHTGRLTVRPQAIHSRGASSVKRAFIQKISPIRVVLLRPCVLDDLALVNYPLQSIVELLEIFQPRDLLVKPVIFIPQLASGSSIVGITRRHIGRNGEC